MRGHQPRLPGLGFEEMTSRSRGVLLALAILVASLSGPVSPAEAEPGIAVATNRILAGVYAPQQWSSAEHIQALNAASTTKISIGGIWYDVGDRSSNMVHLLDQIWSAGTTPFVNIHVGVSAAEVAAGAIDHLIRNLGTSVSYWLSKGEGRSVMLAPMPEMNGDWIPYGKTPNAFKDAYRRFVTLASESGSFERVRWVFAPNGWSAPPHKMAAYYPGADVVDLVGISAYNWGSLQAGARWTTVQETMAGALDEARGFAPEKPFLVSQTASSSFGGDKDAWIREMFAFLANDPNAVGFIYFNIEKEQDWSVYYGEGVVAPGWRDGMNLPTTSYEWPLHDWFAPGLLFVDTHPPSFNGTFADDDASAFQEDIEWLVQSGITTGCGSAAFCPASPVTRGEMAAFLVRATSLPAASADYFSDDSGSPYETSANQVKEAGITIGCTATAYCPNAPTTRGQMASFLVRALQLSPAAADYFADDGGSVHQGHINALRLAGITSGCTATSFCPSAVVTREQMAAFLHRALAP